MNKNWKIFFSILALINLLVFIKIGFINGFSLSHDLSTAAIIFAYIYYFSPLALVNIISIGIYLIKYWNKTSWKFRSASLLVVITSIIWAKFGLSMLIY